MQHCSKKDLNKYQDNDAAISWQRKFLLLKICGFLCVFEAGIDTFWAAVESLLTRESHCGFVREKSYLIDLIRHRQED